MEENTKEFIEVKKESETTDKSQKKQRLFYVPLVVLFIFIFAFILIFNSSDDDKDKTDNEKGNETQVKVYEHNVSEKFNFDGVEYTITKYKIDDYYTHPTYYGDYEPSNNNNTFCIIYLEMHNSTGKNKELVDDGIFTDDHIYTHTLYCDDAEFNTTWGSGNKAFLKNHDSLLPYETIECVLLFELPWTVANNSQEIKLEMTFNKIADQDEFHIVKLKG